MDEDFDADSLKKVVKNVDEYLWGVTNNVVCTICHELFTEPVTTLCGHTFCSECLKRLLYAADSSNTCPLCRHPIKRRESKSNHVLSKIAKICLDFPSAFKKDVLNLGANYKDAATELISTSRISQISFDKSKEQTEVLKRGSRRKSNAKKTGKCIDLSDSVASCSEVANDDCGDLKSISQREIKSPFYVADSPDIEKKLRKVKKVASKEKVNEWLLDAGKKISDTVQPLKGAKEDESGIQSVNKDVNSVIRVDYDKSKLNGKVEDSLKSISHDAKSLTKDETDPYEFIASQRSSLNKSKKKLGGGRKKKVPEFESLHNFTKDYIKKGVKEDERDVDDGSVVFNRLGDKMLVKTQKTYSRRNSIEGQKISRPTKISESEDSNASHNVRSGDDDSPRRPSARRRLITSYLESDSELSMNGIDSELVAKKPKLDAVPESLDASVLNTSNGESENSSGKKSINKKSKRKLKTLEVPANTSRSPGWSRVSNLKLDFENAEKRNRPCRKTLNISGGEPNSGGAKSKTVLKLSPEDGIGVVNDDLYIEDLSQCSQLVTGFDAVASAEKKKDFKQMVEDMERELEGVDKSATPGSNNIPEERPNIGRDHPSVTDLPKPESPKPEEKTIVDEKSRDEKFKDEFEISCERSVVMDKPSGEWKVPFALLGKIKRKKPSISFVKVGCLFPNVKRSQFTVLRRPASPKNAMTNTEKIVTTSAGIQTDDPISTECDNWNLPFESTVMKSAESEGPRSDKIEVEVQTTQSCLQSTTKEVQTSQIIEKKTVTVQTFEDGSVKCISLVPSQMFDDFRTPQDSGSAVTESKEQSKVGGSLKKDVEDEFDTEIQCELNKTWTTNTQTQGCGGSEKMPPPPPPEVNVQSQEEEVIDLVESCSSRSEVLMQRAVDNVNLDLARVRASRASPAKPDHCEESDSDIFIEQTPPRNTSVVVNRPEEEGKTAAGETEESFLILSECPAKTPDYVSEVKGNRTEKAAQLSFTFPTKQMFTAVESNRRDNDENNQNHMNRNEDKGERKDEGNPAEKRLCILSSGVVNRKNVEKFVKMFNAEYLNHPRKDMTHLVVGMHTNDDDEMVPYCTPKLLYAIANKKWVMTEAWVEYCIHSNKIAKEEHFESVDPEGGNGCTLARLSKGYLLDACEVYLLGDYEGITKEEFSNLVRDCGGTIVSRPSEFSYASKKIRMILAAGSELQGDHAIETLAKKYRTLVMSRDVILISIQRYKMANFTPFLLHSITVEKCLEWGYPYDLIKKEVDADKSANGPDYD